MKKFLSIIAFSLCAVSPSAAQQPAPDQVIISIYGRDYTSAEIENLRENLPAQFKQNVAHMSNRAFLQNFGYLQALAKLADDEKMLEQEPFKTQFEFNRTNYLAQIYLAQLSRTIEVGNEDLQAYYEAHKSDFSSNRISAIAFDFSPIPELAQQQGKPVVTDEEAWAKADQARTEIVNGADFAAVARTRSDDKGSAEKGGDLGVIDPADKSISDNVRDAIARLEPGQVSAPLKDGARYYLFQVSERVAKPYSEVQSEVQRKVRDAKLKERMDQIRGDVKIVYDEPGYLDAMGGK